MKFHWDLEQRTPEWHALRAGRLTASDAGKLITPTGRPSASAEKLLGGKAAGALGLIEDARAWFAANGWRDPYEFDTAWMARGRELEPEAWAWFKFEVQAEVKACGFVEVDEFTGFSPDGIALVDPDTQVPVELKCPAPETHCAYLMDGSVPKEYLAQVHAQMFLCGSPFAWFMSYCPGVRPLLIKVERSDFTDKVADAFKTNAAALKKLIAELEA